MITVPRWLMLVLAVMFSAYHIVLGISSLDIPVDPWPAIVALVLYAVATVLSLWPVERMRMPDWLAAFDLGVSIAIPLLVTSRLDPSVDNGYATWYVAAVGTLMTIAAARRQLVIAWLGVAALAVQTVVWAGFPALGGLGVVGSIVWVAIAHMLTAALASSARDAQRYAQAEREAAAWQAAQDAHVFEGRMRLAHTNRLAAPMLRRIADRGGVLTEEQRRECRMLEAAIRDEIRGRMLLTDVVRLEVQRARERGVTVTLLDEGGIDDLEEPVRERVLSALADAIAGSAADRIIARTAAEGSEIAVTVVGLLVPDHATPVAGDSEDAEVELWLEIPRTA
jgi:membrane protein CcdC involved in cytochrome C biogenesis